MPCLWQLPKGFRCGEKTHGDCSHDLVLGMPCLWQLLKGSGCCEKTHGDCSHDLVLGMSYLWQLPKSFGCGEKTHGGRSRDFKIDTNFCWNPNRWCSILLRQIAYDCLTAYQFKQIVKSAVRKAAFEHLLTLQQGHSKYRNVKHHTFKMQPYLNDHTMTKDDIWQTRCSRGCPTNSLVIN